MSALLVFHKRNTFLNFFFLKLSDGSDLIISAVQYLTIINNTAYAQSKYNFNFAGICNFNCS